MTVYHHLSAAHFAALASGLGGPAAVHELESVQYSKRLLLLRHLADFIEDQTPDEAVNVLARAQRQSPSALVHLITDPAVGAWATQTTRRLLHTHRGPATEDLAQFGALAAAAAIRGGVDAEVATHTLSGSVVLPTLGKAVLSADGPAVVTVTAGRATVTAGPARVTVNEDDRCWLGLRKLTARDGDLTGSVTIEDGNPYRDCYHAAAAGRLPESDVERWQEVFAEAWHLLARYIPDRAGELAAGLRSVVPLVTKDDGVARSGTARDAFGMVGLTRPGSAADLAVTLVHEFQHSKLSAVLDLVSLYESEGSERHFAPWREDPRPTAGLIQGVYAFLGVADTWRALRAAPGLEERATREFAFGREQVAAGLTALEASRELTPAGQTFVGGLRQAVQGLRAENLSPSQIVEATERLAKCRRAWDSHNADMSSLLRTTR